MPDSTISLFGAALGGLAEGMNIRQKNRDKSFELYQKLFQDKSLRLKKGPDGKPLVFKEGRTRSQVLDMFEEDPTKLYRGQVPVSKENLQMLLQTIKDPVIKDQIAYALDNDIDVTQDTADKMFSADQKAQGIDARFELERMRQAAKNKDTAYEMMKELGKESMKNPKAFQAWVSDKRIAPLIKDILNTAGYTANMEATGVWTYLPKAAVPGVVKEQVLEKTDKSEAPVDNTEAMVDDFIRLRAEYKNTDVSAVKLGEKYGIDGKAFVRQNAIRINQKMKGIKKMDSGGIGDGSALPQQGKPEQLASAKGYDPNELSSLLSEAKKRGLGINPAAQQPNYAQGGFLASTTAQGKPPMSDETLA